MTKPPKNKNLCRYLHKHLNAKGIVRSDLPLMVRDFYGYETQTHKNKGTQKIKSPSLKHLVNVMHSSGAHFSHNALYNLAV